MWERTGRSDSKDGGTLHISREREGINRGGRSGRCDRRPSVGHIAPTPLLFRPGGESNNATMGGGHTLLTGSRATRTMANSPLIGPTSLGCLSLTACTVTVSRVRMEDQVHHEGCPNACRCSNMDAISSLSSYVIGAISTLTI